MSFDRWLNGTLSLENAKPPSRSDRYAVIETSARGVATTFRPGLSIVGERSNDDREMRAECATRLRRALASAQQVVLRDKHLGTQQIVAFVDVDHDTLQFLGNRMGKDGTADLVKRAFRDDVGIRQRLDAHLKDDHSCVLRDLNLARMPRSEMESQWIRDIRRQEKRETHLRKPLSLATRPTYYRGFIDDSYVDLWVRSPRSQSATLRFRGSEFEASIAIHIPQTDRARIGHGVYFAARPAQIRVWAALRLPPEENMFGRNVLLFSPDAWSDCRDPDVFDDIALDINTDGEVSIVAATVVLNDMVLSNFDYPQPIVAKQIRNASLKDSIAIGRLNALIHDPATLSPSNAATNRRPFTGILERPDVQLSPILVTAAMELGQSWHERYEAPWNYFYFDGSKHWMTAPRDWCSEFVLWCLRKSTNLPLDIESDPQGGIAAHDLVAWFTNQNRFIGPTRHPFNYEDLGQAVLPGFYTSINDGGHSTLFIGWWDSTRQVITTFNRNADRNMFLAIGGNQDFQRTAITRYEIARTSSIINAEMHWGPIWFDCVDREGFGDSVRSDPSFAVPWISNNDCPFRG